MKKLIQFISRLFTVKKKFTRPILEHERRILENAKQKKFKPTVEVVQQIAKGGDFSVELSYKPLHSQPVVKQYPLTIVNSREIGLAFKITMPEHPNVGGVLHKESYGLANALKITNGGNLFYTENDSVISFKTRFPSKPQILEGKISHLKTFKNQPEPHYIRLVIHIHDTDMTFPTELLDYGENYMKFDYSGWEFQESLMGIPFMSTKGMYAQLTIAGHTFDFYGLENINSIVLDSCNKISIDEFKRISYAIRLCFSFLCGKFYRDEIVYLFSEAEDFSEIKQFEYKLEPTSILSDNKLINPTLFFGSFSARSQEEQDDLAKYHTMFPIAVFSNLCEIVMASPELIRCVELVVNAGNISDAVQKGAMYSVAIETLTEHLKGLNEEALKPIRDKELWKEFLAAQQELLDKFESKLEEDSYRILQAKISNLNSPTNRDKLHKPFEMYGVSLSEQDKETLNHRNKYLHGGTPTDSAWITEQNMIALRLHTLIGALLLKVAGYQGHYVNLSAWHVMHQRETNDLMAHIDVRELASINARLAAGSMGHEELVQAKEFIERCERYFKSLLEMQDLIRILE